MKIVIPGGSGQLGCILARSFNDRGHQVTVLSRNPGDAPWKTFYWDGENPGPWTETLEGADVIINMAGRCVNCRYNATNQKEIIDSRVNSTKAVGQAIEKAANPPKLWLQAATATIYAHRYDAPNDDITGQIGGTEPDVPKSWKFSIEVATRWEEACRAFHLPETRKVIMRSAMVMSPDQNGVFDLLSNLVRRGLGGHNGHGRQFVSWIHDQDFVRAIDHLIEHEELEGVVNLAAPEPLPNHDFMSALRQSWGIPFGLPATRWMLEIGAFFMRTETELILKSRRVTPSRLLNSGFDFKFPSWPKASQQLCDRHWRKSA